MVVEVTSQSVADTLALGRKLAALLRPDDVVLLAGRLGSGKTVLASGVAEGLGVSEQVISPTFVLVKAYQGFLPFVHADAYRLGTAAEVEDLGLEDEARGGVLVVEWGDAVAGEFGEDHLVVEMEVTGPEVRVVRFRPSGSWEARPLHELAA